MLKPSVIRPAAAPAILAHASVVGRKEHEGPLGRLFDYHDESDRFGTDSWEKAEGEMQRLALNLALKKARLPVDAIDMLAAGDLINQCTASSYGLLSFPIPYLGLYGACSTSAEGLIVAALFLAACPGRKAAVVTSSHNCTAERQFRSPVAYGGQRTPTAQWTVTGAAAFLLGEGHGPRVTEVLPGVSVDEGISDANNMGAAMAPAACHTLLRYFRETGRRPTDFDGIFTGDLGFEGSTILTEAMQKAGCDIRSVHHDCGLLIYDRDSQDVHAGGSGCGCSASVLSAHLLPMLERGRFRDILFVATGALLSPMAVQQGQTIPGIAHLVRITKEETP